MIDIHINVGSNQNRQQNIKNALKSLELIFDNLLISTIYESPAEGFIGDDFYNVGVSTTTVMSPCDILKTLRTIEKKQSSKPKLTKFASREIDLDLIFYGNLTDKNKNLPRHDILKYAFILAPLAEISSQTIHSPTALTYQKLWQQFKLNNQYQLTKVTKTIYKK